ncbi:hypothetical protein J4G48_0015435 [Bradyrhizobium barranii subsp. apii]|uniref:hypothetical protein n=1 Tax=Bradyrhizobium barranii TaxID=2992140 RepID=UPI001AA0BAC1|nr:hypothetical protein [Bradyrhizobium barranii]UPT99356.1 hypothetical protein J4G48_0015435 [Bradyrhizobium barranii subsp. apii]
MPYPTGILHNAATGRFHPIVFRLAPMPGGADSALSAQRYKSKGHHTEGFATLDEAKAWIGTEPAPGFTMVPTGEEWEWDGTDVPALVQFYEVERLIAEAKPSEAANG